MEQQQEFRVTWSVVVEVEVPEWMETEEAEYIILEQAFEKLRSEGTEDIEVEEL